MIDSNQEQINLTEKKRKQIFQDFFCCVVGNILQGKKGWSKHIFINGK